MSADRPIWSRGAGERFEAPEVERVSSPVRPCFATEGHEGEPLNAALVALLRRPEHAVAVRRVPHLGSSE